jgi:hypothetical protein
MKSRRRVNSTVGLIESLFSMHTVFRLVAGFVIGCVLFRWALVLASVGEGSMTPLGTGAPELFPLIVIFEKFQHGAFWFWLIVFGAGLLWSFYWGVLPAISSFGGRILAFMVVAVLHFGGGLFTLSRDLGFGVEFRRYPVLMIGYFVFFGIILLSLGVLTWVGLKPRVSAAVS